MPSTVVDRVCPAPQSLAGVAPAPKPTRRFDDVLNSSRDRMKPEPTPIDRTTNSEKSEPEKVDAPPSDEIETTATDDVPAEQPAETKPAKRPAEASKKSQGDTTAEGEASDEAGQAVTGAATTPAIPTLAIPVKGEADALADGELAIDVDEETPIVDAPLTDLAAVAAQLPVAPTPMAEDVSAPAEIASPVAVAAPAETIAKPVVPADAPPAPPEIEAVEGAPRPTLKPQEFTAATSADDAAALMLPAEPVEVEKAKAAIEKMASEPVLQVAMPPTEKPAESATSLPAAAATPEAPQRTVAEDNVDRIVTSVRGELLTKGGAMQIRLDPPSLGTINVQINVDDGVFSASLQTTNDEATRLLSHNLAQLKSQLESAGVTVDRIQVKQAAPSESSSNSQNASDSDARQQNRDAGQDQTGRQEQQRREMLQRMWARVAGDPLDLVA